MSKKPKKNKREKTLCEELNWGQDSEFFGLRPKPSDDEVDQYRATTTGQKPPLDSEIAELDAEPEFQPLKDAGMTAEDLALFIRIKQGL